MQSNELIEQIRKRAYQIWETKGRPAGRALDHWLEAETECRPRVLERKPAAPRLEITKPQSKGAKKPQGKKTPKPPRG